MPDDLLLPYGVLYLDTDTCAMENIIEAVLRTDASGAVVVVARIQDEDGEPTDIKV